MRSIPAALLALVPAAALTFAACHSTPTREVVDSYVEGSDGVLLHFVKLGTRTDKVVLVPGGSWVRDDLARLADSRTVVFYDLRGRGRSGVLPPDQPPTLEQDVADMELVRDWLGIESFSILAFDYQAAVAAHYARAHPERVERMVLVSPVPPRRRPYLEIYEAVYNARLNRDKFRDLMVMKNHFVNVREPKVWADAYRDALYSGWVQDASVIERVKSSPFIEPNLDPERLIAQYMNLLAGLGEWDWRTQLVEVSAPALVISGENDPMPHQAYEEWVEMIPGAVEYVLPRCGRLPWIEHPYDFFRAASRFLDGRSSI